MLLRPVSWAFSNYGSWIRVISIFRTKALYQSKVPCYIAGSLGVAQNRDGKRTTIGTSKVSINQFSSDSDSDVSLSITFICNLEQLTLVFVFLDSHFTQISR